MTWIVFSFVTACAILAVARPFMRAGLEAAGAGSEAEAYKEQLAELSREEERGTIGKGEAEQTRTEISRRLLRASRQSAGAAVPGGQPLLSANTVFAGLAAVVTIAAIALYGVYGSPGLPDQPLQARLSAPPEQQSLAVQVANVERRLRAHPDDALGWRVIAPVYFKTGQFDKAADAYRKLIELSGEDEEVLYGLFEALTFGNDGQIPASAKPALEAALARNPKSLRGRFWLALSAAQDGRKADAEAIFREMLGEDIPSEWKGIIHKQLAELSAGAGGNEASGQQAAGGEGGQAAMIRGMVERLAARLKENGADLSGWLRLIQSYSVLKDTAKAQEAIASAKAQFASDPKALEQIDNLTQSLGIKPAAAMGG
jgi:cytochrome c-type biogenesis protein CcmH